MDPNSDQLVKQQQQPVQSQTENSSNSSNKSFWKYIAIGMAIVSFLTAIGAVGFVLTKR